MLYGIHVLNHPSHQLEGYHHLYDPYDAQEVSTLAGIPCTGLIRFPLSPIGH